MLCDLASWIPLAARVSSHNLVLTWLNTVCRDGEVPSQKELSSYFEELLVVKFLVKRNLVPQMMNFSPTLILNYTFLKMWSSSEH